MAECEHPRVVGVLVGTGRTWLCTNRDCKQEFAPVDQPVVSAAKIWDCNIDGHLWGNDGRCQHCGLGRGVER